MILLLIAFEAAAATPNLGTDYLGCVNSEAIRFEKSGEAAPVVADATLTACRPIIQRYRQSRLENRPANARISYEQAKGLVDHMERLLENSGRDAAIQKVVEIRADRAEN